MPFGYSVGRHLPAVGVGIAIGAGAAFIIDRWFVFAEVRRLRAAVEYLRQEWLQMKEKLESNSIAIRRNRSGSGLSRSSTGGSEYLSANPSSGEDEEEFEEALEWYTTPPDALLYKDAQESFDQIEDETLKNLFQEVETLYKGSDDEKIRALELLREHYPQYSKNVELLWRLARQCMLVGDVEKARGNDDKRKELLYAGKDYAHMALMEDDNSSNAHKWYALCLGSAGDYEPTQQKIQNGFIFKDHIEKAIRLRPNEAALRHFMGRWCYEVAQLSWLERKAAAALYATPPTATVDQAMDYFLQAENLEPGFWKTNSLYLAKCYIYKASYVYARMWLEKCLQMPSESEEEADAHMQAKNLMEKYRDYY